MNSVILIGRLVRDVDVRYTAGDNSMCVARYTLAVDRKYKKEGQPTADFVPCVALARNAEFTEKYFHKGTKIAVRGHIQTGSYTNKDGNKVFTTEVLVEEQEFAESKSQSSEKPQPVPEEKVSEFLDVPEDSSDFGELPFR